MSKHADVVIIGAGQAGLAMSQCLTARGISHVILERGRTGERWLSERWPSLRLLTPNWMMRLPGLRPARDDAEGFMRGSDFATVLAAYGRGFGAPVVGGAEVLRLERQGSGYRVTTQTGIWSCRSAVIATGASDLPAVPSWAGDLSPDLHQVTTAGYRRAGPLPAGGVLVVGASASGIQIADEIHRSGRPVTLAVGRHVRTPRRYRGQDIMAWLDASGFLSDPRPEDADPRRLRAQPSLQIIGSRDARDIGLASLAASGVRVVGRAAGAEGRVVTLSDTLQAECAAAEARRRKLLGRIDLHIEAHGLPVPEERDAWEPPAPLPGAPARLDLRAEGIATVLWATGYRRSYPWLKLPVLDRDGEIINRGGLTPAPGLVVLGLPFMRHRASAFIDGVGRDAEALSQHIARYLRAGATRAA